MIPVNKFGAKIYSLQLFQANPEFTNNTMNTTNISSTDQDALTQNMANQFDVTPASSDQDAVTSKVRFIILIGSKGTMKCAQSQYAITVIIAQPS